MARIVAQVDLPRAGNFLFGIEEHLLPLRDPTGSARNREQNREHGHGEPHRLVDEAGVEVHVGIELTLHKIFIFEGDALAFESDLEKRVLAHQIEYFVGNTFDDARARIVKGIAYEVFDLMGKNPLLEIALECERIALEDEYFVKRKLYPNVDFYTGLIYQS